MKNSTKIAIALGVILIVVVGVIASHRSPNLQGINPSGGDIIQSVTTNVNGVTIGAKFQQWYALNLPIGTNQVSWRNTTGQVAYVSGARFTMASTTPNGNTSASSTLVVSVGTSTTATITDTSTPWGGLINQVSIATGTTAFDAGSQIVLAGQAKSGVGGATSTIAVAPNEYVIAVVENPFSLNCGASGLCESGTSTKRGYILNGIFEVSF